MIKDNISNAEIYYNLGEKFKLGFEWIKNNDMQNIPDGRYDISDGIYANVQTYSTKTEALFEAHKKYADIQYMIRGREKCGVSNYENTQPEIEYDTQKDIEFLKTNKAEYLTLEEKEFFIFYPQDAHKPSLHAEKQQNVKKVVVKIPL